MILSKQNLPSLTLRARAKLPTDPLFNLPERVLQFGTGVLLRGLPDAFIDEANRNSVFNGRIVVVKSTDKGGTEAFAQQDHLYTLCVRGIVEGKQIDEQTINASISRVLSAHSEWPTILALATSKELQIVVSNTTETGIKLVPEQVLGAGAPHSFPGKLVALLYERYKFFDGAAHSGLVILPTELVPDNGKLLQQICLQLAAINQLEEDFMYWLQNANDFCNTLVDRIVPGALPASEYKKMTQTLGYEDELMIMAEPYALWAIETKNDRTKEILSFANIHKGVLVANSINKHRELKLRLLNASHTFTCALALICGFTTVKEAMQHKEFHAFIKELMLQEIVPTLIGKEIGETEAVAFAHKVLDRFANPFIAHEWKSISFQYTSKWVTRCLPLLLNHYKKYTTVPKRMALGFAAYLLLLRSTKTQEGHFLALSEVNEFALHDEKAVMLHRHWQEKELKAFVHAVLADQSLWKEDLTQLPGWEEAVRNGITQLDGGALRHEWNLSSTIKA